MYNRTHYNRQSYNRKSRSEFEWTGTATAESRASGSLLIERRLAGNVAEAAAEAFGEIIRRHLFEALPRPPRRPPARSSASLFSGTAVAEANASGAGVATYGQEVMTILGVNMVPGDELVIDTEHMTVTLNGENIIDRVSDDAVFFKLMSGINDITVEGGTTADVRIVWKDRWL
jgi:hypothetical protein